MLELVLGHPLVPFPERVGRCTRAGGLSRRTYPSNKQDGRDLPLGLQTFTSAGGAETFEEFTLSQVVETNVIYVTAVEGPDVFGVPDWRNIDLMVIGTVVSPVKHVSPARVNL